MESLAWVALTGAILVGVHLAIIWYLHRQVGDEVAGSRFEPDLENEREVESPEDGKRVCLTCGTTNETHYRFCRSCVSDLRSGSPTSNGSTNTGRLRG